MFPQDDMTTGSLLQIDLESFRNLPFGEWNDLHNQIYINVNWNTKEKMEIFTSMLQTICQTCKENTFLV